jgi:hypothetical protein
MQTRIIAMGNEQKGKLRAAFTSHFFPCQEYFSVTLVCALTVAREVGRADRHFHGTRLSDKVAKPRTSQ